MDLHFNPKYDYFQPRTMWNLSNAFTSAFKELEPVPHFLTQTSDWLGDQSETLITISIFVDSFPRKWLQGL
jgi:hypothetical protein